MIIPDVNMWIPALRADSPHHDRHRAWLLEALEDPEPVGISELIFSSVVRILTNPRIFRQPSSTGTVLSALESLRAAPGTTIVTPGGRHWSIFVDICGSTNAAGNLVADAYHAALAIESDATFVTLDSDFAAFPGLDLSYPFG